MFTTFELLHSHLLTRNFQLQAAIPPFRILDPRICCCALIAYRALHVVQYDSDWRNELVNACALFLPPYEILFFLWITAVAFNFPWWLVFIQKDCIKCNNYFYQNNLMSSCLSENKWLKAREEKPRNVLLIQVRFWKLINCIICLSMQQIAEDKGNCCQFYSLKCNFGIESGYGKWVYIKMRYWHECHTGSILIVHV